MADLTEAEAVAKIILDDPGHEEIASEVSTLVVPEGATVETFDTERYLPAPLRASGVVTVHNAEAFAAAVKQRKQSPTAVYADEENRALVAVLNDDTPEAAGWRDLRVQLALRPTPEWLHWTRGSGKLMEQEPFAVHIETGRLELVTPPPGEMLELAQTFQATKAAKFRTGSRLADGRRQFQYDEEIEATAGSTGQVIIPNTLVLGITPFYGAQRFEVTALFRFRLNRAELTLGYILDRPYEVERAAFNAVRDSVAELLSVTPIAGVAPAKGGRA